MKADTIRLLDLLAQSKAIFEIPVYQRNYEWREEQCRQLFKDILLAAKEQKPHFTGAVVYVEESGPNMSHIYNIIDGQQRLTSCSLLLKAIADTSNDEELKEEIETNYLKNKFLSDNNHIRLKSVEKDREAYYAIMSDRIDEYDKPSKMKTNYKLFIRLIEESELSSSELFTAINFLNVVYIEINSNRDEENPQVIFESLNSTGVSLSASDLVRNFILMSLDSEEQTKLYKEYWIKIESLFINNNIFAEFIRHYLISKTKKAVKRENTYSVYKKYYYEQNFNAKEAVKELYTNVRYYSQLLNASTENKEFNKAVSHINTLDKKVLYPYLLKLLDMQVKQEISWNEVVDIAHLLESYIYRRMICSVPSNALNSLVVSLTNKENKNELEVVERRLLNNNFPTDKEFKEKLLEYPIYKKRKDCAKLTLEVLEESKTKETIDFEKTQVEHIMPKKLSTDWRIEVTNAESTNRQYGDTIGNLTLTGYNQEMSNKVYTEKRKFYSKSNIVLSREISEKYEVWDKNSIVERAKNLADELCRIFERPTLIKKNIADTYKGEHNILDELDVTGQKPAYLIIQEHDYQVSTWGSMIVTFFNYIWENDSMTYNKLKSEKTLEWLFSNIRNPKVLKNGDVIETNFSANTVVAVLAKVSEMCGISEEVSYILK